MINVKLIVLFLYLRIVSCFNSYCKICPDHTLCKYRMPGPSPSCREYDEKNRLTKEEVDDIIQKINERRNFVAAGLSRYLPQAANMNKIYWSEELAIFAQRWVDQCDPTTRPDKEDECRNLENTEVGQSIVTVAGPSPGMAVSSLIDVWFTKGLGYSGSISYYNQSRDSKANYFTQLIWGDTDRVGCGRAKFHILKKKSIIERLVCNFAPKGNIHGKPVYAVGYPATQCHRNMVSDKKYPNLCTHWIANNERKYTTHMPTVSLLKILNLSHTSMKQDIDPVKNNLENIKLSNNDDNENRNQKIRHVFLNNSHVDMKKVPQMQWHSNRNHPHQNMSRKVKLYPYQKIGNSRVYHGHDLHGTNYRVENKQTHDQSFRRYNYSTETLKLTNVDDYRKYENTRECTRRFNHDIPQQSTCETPITQCTRGHVSDNYPQTTEKCQDQTNMVGIYFQHEFPHEECPCNTATTCPPTPPKCQCNFNCPCLKSDYSTVCPLSRNKIKYPKGDMKKPPEFHYYDLFPNLAIRSGDTTFQGSEKTSIDPWLQQETTVGNNFKHYTLPKQIVNNQDYIRHKTLNKNYNTKESDYLYDFSDSRERKRRNLEDDMTFKPFWQMAEFNKEKVSQLKSLRYTTIQNRMHKKTKRTSSTKRIPQSTETITIQSKDLSNTLQPIKNVVTEKYLSFEELMHLRRFGTVPPVMQVDARRNEANAANVTTSEYTTNTPFERKKHCTRKLTCTWTAASVTDTNGSVIVPGMDGDRGSRTPPGYVEGCTRTSTCTRDYMDRNKFSTLQEDVSADIESSPTEDEDYCEKRALNVRRRDCYSGRDIHYTSITSTEKGSTPKFIVSKNGNTSNTLHDKSTSTRINNWESSKLKTRTKRSKNYGPLLRKLNTKEKSIFNENLSYGDLYYLIIQKIIDNWKKHKNFHSMTECGCNRGVIIKSSILILIIFIFLYDLLYIQIFLL